MTNGGARAAYTVRCTPTLIIVAGPANEPRSLREPPRGAQEEHVDSGTAVARLSAARLARVRPKIFATNSDKRRTPKEVIAHEFFHVHKGRAVRSGLPCLKAAGTCLTVPLEQHWLGHAFPPSDTETLIRLAKIALYLCSEQADVSPTDIGLARDTSKRAVPEPKTGQQMPRNHWLWPIAVMA